MEISVYDIESDILSYYSPSTSQLEKQNAQNVIQNYLDQWHQKWSELMQIIDNINEYTLSNAKIEDIVQLNFPFEALNNMIETCFSKVSESK